MGECCLHSQRMFERQCSVRHVKIKNHKEDHAFFQFLAFSISFY